MPELKSILLIESDPAALTYLSNMLRGAGYNVLTSSSGKEGLIEAWRNRPDMLIIVPELLDINGLEVARKLRADARTAKSIILMLSARSYPQDILAGVQAGADEYIVKRPGADVELLERVRALIPLETLEAVVEPAKLGRLVTFLSAKGGTGVSSVCVNMAQALAEKAEPKQVAVVDLVLPIGSLHYIVGVETPGKNVIEATKLDARLINPDHLKPMLTRRDEWKFHLLPGSPDPDAAQELKVERLETVITELRKLFDYVLVDFGRALSRVSLPVIRQSARIVLIVSPDAATVSLTKTTIQFLDSKDIRRHQIMVVLNRAVGLEGLTRPDMEKELGFAIPALVPYMGGQFALANNQHQPLSLKFPNDTVTYTLQDLSNTLLTQLAQTTELTPAAA
jgi:Flp pilus assembly CpaE family ATPase